jgi:hypothetical protein
MTIYTTPVVEISYNKEFKKFSDTEVYIEVRSFERFVEDIFVAGNYGNFGKRYFLWFKRKYPGNKFWTEEMGKKQVMGAR